MIKTLLSIIKPWSVFEKRGLFLKVTKLFASAKFLKMKNLVGIIYFGAILLDKTRFFQKVGMKSK